MAEEEAKASFPGGKIPAGRVLGFFPLIALRPAMVAMLCEEAVGVTLRILRSRGVSRLYLDSSGGFVQEMSRKKKTFLYILNMRSATHPNLNTTSSPTFSWLSASHDTSACLRALDCFWSTVSKRIPGDWARPSETVTDASLPLIRSLSLAINQLPLWLYVNKMYELVQKRLSVEEIGNFAIQTICGFHTLAAWDLPVARTKLDFRRNTELRKMLAFLVMSESLNRLSGLMENLGFILSAKVWSDDVQSAIEDFEKLGDLDPETVQTLAAGMEAAEVAAVEALDQSVPSWSENSEDGEGGDGDGDGLPRRLPRSDPTPMPPPPNIHLRKYFLKRPSQEEVTAESFSASTQRDRSLFYKTLSKCLDAGVGIAAAHDSAQESKVGEQEVEDGELPALYDNPFKSQRLIDQIRNTFCPHAFTLKLTLENNDLES